MLACCARACTIRPIPPYGLWYLTRVHAASHDGRTSQGRIAPLDGLRAIAVVGVIYAHVWSFVLGTPVLRIGPVDVNRLLALFGTGVDLFFVISGFCMFLTYDGRQRTPARGDFSRFVKNRFRRIAPSFYAAVFVSALFAQGRDGKYPLAEVCAYLTFVFTVVPGLEKLAVPFWSLATEWHFYLLLPPLLFFARRRGFVVALVTTMTASIVFRLACALMNLDVAGVSLDHFILSRFVEFGWGIVAARLYILGLKPPPALRGSLGFLIGWAVSLAGRFMMTDAASRVPRIGPCIAALSLTVLSFGYMLVVWNVVSGPSSAARICGSGPMRWVGRISFGLYLWHWDIGLGIARRLEAVFGAGPASPLLYLFAILAVLLPLAEVSFRLLEAPYFRQRAADVSPRFNN